MDGAELKEAIREACDSAEVFDFADLNLKAKTKTLKNAYEKLLGKKEGAVYELDVPVNDDYAPDGTSVKVFYNAATEDVAFLFINESDMVVTFRANVDGYETNRVTVNPNPANVEDGETAVYVEDYSNTIMIDDMPQTLGAELIGTEGNAEAREGEPEQETETKAPDGSESLEASTATEETVEMTQEAEMEDTAAETLPEEAETKETEAVVEEQPEEETEAVVIEIESAEETEEEAATESEVVIEPEIESGELVGMSHHLVDRVGTPEETQEETAVVILDESEETTEAPEEETEQETEEEAMEESEETAAESIEETEEKELEENESSVEETTATAASDTEDEESEEVAMEESSSAAVSEETEEQESSTEEITEAAVEETTEGSVTEGTEAPEDGQMLIDDVNADGENAIVVLGDLEGKPYNTVTIWDSANARAFKVSVEDLEGIEAFGSYAVDYSVDPLGTAEVEGPSYIAEGEDLYFSVTPQVGYVIEQVLANGEEVELADEADLASLSDATKSNADLEDAEEGTAFYVIPDVQEDQEIEVILAEEVLGSHPEFHEEKTVNGVTITVSAEEGILPAGTTLSVEEVTEQVADALKEKVEREATEGTVEVTSMLAYDITLSDATGKQLNDSWNKNGYVKVEFSGQAIKEKSKDADSIEIMHVDTVVDATKHVVLTDDVAKLDKVSDTVAVPKSESVEKVEFNAEHFSIYTVMFTKNDTSGSLTIHVVDENGTEIGNGGEVTVTLTDDSTQVSDVATQIKNQDGSLSSYDFVKATTSLNGTTTISTIYLDNGKLYRTRSWLFGYYYSDPIETVYFQFKSNKPVVTFNGNGATNGTVPNPVIVDVAGSEITLPDQNDLVKDGYAFVGWSKTGNASAEDIGKGTIVIYRPGTSIIVDESITLYAIWVEENPSEDVHFFIRLDGVIQNEPSSEQAAAYTGHDTNSGMYFAESETVLKEAKFVTDPTGEAVLDNLNKTPTVAAMVTAMNNYPDSLKKYYDIESLSEADFDENSGDYYVLWYVIKIPTNPDGYWHVDGVLLKRSKVTLAYDLNCTDYASGSKTPSGGSYNKGAQVTVKDDSIFSRPGYVFTGWNTKTDGTGTWYQSNEMITLNENTVLYAQWKNANAGLELRKVLVNAGNDDDVTKVTFALYKANVDWNKASEIPLESSIRTKADGTVSIQLEHDGTNNRYLLYEITTAPGYMVLSEPIKLEVTFDSSNKITYKVNGSETEYSLANPYTINNYKGVEFPITGGSGL
ncbi:MAG: InlB B-repeat-containing protein, partial [Lachnospiraceae bacterium]|nr:InlB B-repeat-containing protein [Lachnospiraceae bacterium]